MNWSQFKGHASHICLAGAVVASWSLMEEVTGSSPFAVMTNRSFLSLNSGKTFRENSNEFILYKSHRLVVKRFENIFLKSLTLM